MPELGTKFDCYNCGTKFYDLGKPEPLCPKCGANQKDVERNDHVATGQSARKRRKAEVTKAIDVDEDDGPIDDLPPDEEITPEGIDEEDLADDEEEDFDDEE